MENPVDLTNLRSVTEGDKEMEKMLFEEFITSFESILVTLQKALEQDIAETWRKEMHALKGISLSLGAEKLAEYCKKGQDDFQAPLKDKAVLLKSIIEEYGRVKIFLNTLM